MARVVTMVVTPNAAAARVEHTYLKRGVYYFNRRVPLDISRHYKSRRINFSLRTKSVRTARQSVTAISGYAMLQSLLPICSMQPTRKNPMTAHSGSQKPRTCTCA